MLNENVKFALIMLAHDGIKNQYIWSEWFKKDLSNQIGIIAYISINHKDLTDFEKTSVCKEVTRNMKTQWGDKSLVNVTLKLLEEALLIFPNATRFKILSGRDIPISNPNEYLDTQDKKTILEAGTQTNFCVMNGYIQLDRYSTSHKDLILDKDILRKIKDKFPKYKTGCFGYHSQWMCITRKDVDILVDFKFYDDFSLIDEHLADQSVYPYLLDFKKSNLNATTTISDSIYFPDEYYFGAVLKMHYGIAYFNNTYKTTTYSIFKTAQEHSPILFNCTNQLYHQTLIELDNDIVGPTMKLHQVIKGCHFLKEKSQKVLMTLRKVELDDAQWIDYLDKYRCPFNSQITEELKNDYAEACKQKRIHKVSYIGRVILSNKGVLGSNDKNYTHPKTRKRILCYDQFHAAKSNQQELNIKSWKKKSTITNI